MSMAEEHKNHAEAVSLGKCSFASNHNNADREDFDYRISPPQKKNNI